MKTSFSVVAIIVLVLVLLGTYREAQFGTTALSRPELVVGPSVEVAIVANAVGGTLTFINLASRQVLGERNVIADGIRPGVFRDPLQWALQPLVERSGGKNYAQDTDLSPDGAVVYVSRGFLGDVIAMEIATGDVLWRTPISGLRADHMAVSADGKRLYVSALISSGNVVDVLDAHTGKHIGNFPGGSWPHDIHENPTGDKIYVASLGDMTADLAERGNDPEAYLVSVVDADGFQTLAKHRFRAGVRPFAVTADEGRVYAQLSNEHSVVVYSLAQRDLLHELALPVAEGVTEADWDFESPHHGLALSGDESTLCLAGRASDYAALVDAESLTLRSAVPTGDAPSWAAIDSTDTLCVLANNRSDDVSLIALVEGMEVARLPAGRGPKHVTIGKVPKAVLDSLARD